MFVITKNPDFRIISLKEVLYYNFFISVRCRRAKVSLKSGRFAACLIRQRAFKHLEFTNPAEEGKGQIKTFNAFLKDFIY